MPTLRAQISCFNVSDNTGQFKISKKSFTQQFSQLYYSRLQALRPIILKRLASSQNFHIGRVLDVEEGKENSIIGTVFCENIDRPNVFEEVENDMLSNYKASKAIKYIKDSLIVFLEDESGRIELDISRYSDYPWITGTTLGLKGLADSVGKFSVHEIIEPGLPRASPIDSSKIYASPKYIALVSGLNYGEENAEYSLHRSQMLDLLNGSLHSNFGVNIVKLIIAGNTMSSPIKISNEFKKKYGHEVAKYKVDHLYQIDREISNLSKSINIEIMPGADDLSIMTLPQTPVPKYLFPVLSKIPTVNFTTNPCLFDFESIRFLGCSGQNIDDAFRHVRIENDDRISIAEKTLQWRNIAPTTPDSLFCYPFFEKDPFIINEAPHIYFIGNQPYFGTKSLKSEDGGHTRIVLIPDFSKTGIFVLVNINDLSAIPFKIKT